MKIYPELIPHIINKHMEKLPLIIAYRQYFGTVRYTHSSEVKNDYDYDILHLSLRDPTRIWSAGVPSPTLCPLPHTMQNPIT